jgi:hypothetical protein
MTKSRGYREACVDYFKVFWGEVCANVCFINYCVVHVIEGTIIMLRSEGFVHSWRSSKYYNYPINDPQ